MRHDQPSTPAVLLKMTMVPPRLSSFTTAPQPRASASALSSSSSQPSSQLPLHPLRPSSHLQSTVATPPPAVLAQQLRAWLCEQSKSSAASQQPPLPSVAFLQSTIRNQQTAQLYNFLLQLSPDASNKRPKPAASSAAARPVSSLLTTCEQLSATLASTQRDIDKSQSELQQLQCVVQQQHRQLRQRQADEDDRRRRALLTQTALSKLTHKLDRLQQWNDIAQRPHSDHEQELSAVVETSTEQLQRVCRSINEAAGRTSGVDDVRSIQPLLTALRQRHIELAVDTQRLMKAAAEYDRKTAELSSHATSASSLPLLQRDIAAHRAQLQYVERIQAGEGRQRVNEVQAELKSSAVQNAKLAAQVSHRWTALATLQRQRQQKRQAWQPYIDELRSDHQHQVQPLLSSFSAALTEQQTLMAAEWKQLRDLPISITHRVAVQTAAGPTSTFLLPASSSSLQAVAAPWPMLRPVLDAVPHPWYQSADTLLPSLVAHHNQHSLTHSATLHHSQQLLSTLENDRTLPGFSSLLASSVAVDATHVATTGSLNTLHASLSSLSQSAVHLSQLLQTQQQYGSLQLLPSLRVDGRDATEWIELLSGLEAKFERQRQRAKERKEAQLREAKERFGNVGQTTERKHRYGEDNYSRTAVR